MLRSALNDLGGLGNAPQLVDAVLDLLPDSGVMVIDPDLRVIVMCGQVYEQRGYDVGSAVGRDLHDVIPAISWARVGEHWRAALAGERRTLDSESSDGEADDWLHFAPLRTKPGVVGAIMIAQDITERARVSEHIDHRRVLEAGEPELVCRRRAALQRLMRDEAIAAVEQACGRRVRLLMSDIAPEDDVAIQLFLFEPDGG